MEGEAVWGNILLRCVSAFTLVRRSAAMASIDLLRDSVVDGNVDTSAEIKVVVAAI